MALSKRRWGYIFLGCGLFFLSVGLITGFLIPKIITGMVEKMNCVDSVNDEDFDEWTKEKLGVVTKLYYWEITNKDGFLKKGQMPELKEKGPYVYVQHTQNINVSFQDKRRNFKSWKKPPIFVAEESCPTCLFDDNITVLNLAYFGMMEKFGGDLNFAFLSLPFTVSVLNKSLSYKQLGNINGSVWSDRGLSGWKNPEFGAWLMQLSDMQYKVDRNFTVVEMKGLYNVLMNTATLFGQTLSSTTVKNSCMTNPFDKKCGFLAHLLTFQKLLVANKTLVNITAKAALITLINETLCNNNESCFNRTNLIPVILPYILHVSKYTMWLLLSDEQDDIVQTIKQSDLAYGYTMKKVRDPMSKLVKIPGLLKYYSDRNDAENLALQESVYTCEASEEKRHQWAALNGSETIPNWLFEGDLSQGDEKIGGYSHIVPHSKTADKPCSFSQELPMKSFEAFVDGLWMKLRYTYKEDITFYGLKLKRYVVTKEDFLNHSAVKYGLIDLSKLRKIPVVASMPHFLYSNVKKPASFNQQPNEKKHQGFTDIEPITGIISRIQFRLQINLPINQIFVDVERIERYNITYKTNTPNEFLEKGIPVFWGEHGGEAKESDIDKLKKKVYGLLRLSCGFIVAFPILGGIFIIVAVILFVFSVKGNEITNIT